MCENEVVGGLCFTELVAMIYCTPGVGLDETMPLVYSTEAATLLVELIQNNDDVHHPVASGTAAVTAAPSTVCVYVCTRV